MWGALKYAVIVFLIVSGMHCSLQSIYDDDDNDDDDDYDCDAEGGFCYKGNEDYHQFRARFGHLARYEQYKMALDRLMKVMKCPKNPLTQQRIVDVMDELITCVTEFFKTEHFPEMSGSSENQASQFSKFLCSIYYNLMPCLTDFLKSLEICQIEYATSEVMNVYENLVSRICVNDGEKVAAAMMEFIDEKSPCLELMLLKIRTCYEEINKEMDPEERVNTACRMLDCVKSSWNVCGPKNATNILFDDVMTLANITQTCSWI